MDNNYEIIFCIVNAGFSETVMEASRECGAGGGTVISARGTASKESEQVYNISIEPEKEIVMILVKKEIKENILHALYQKVGLQTPGQGIAFSTPVDDVIGLSENKINS